MTTTIGNSKEDSKPVTSFASPPVSAILTVAAVMGTSIYFFPTIPDPDATVFVHRVFPQYVSVEVLIATRLFFAFVCVIGFASGWLTPT